MYAWILCARNISGDEYHAIACWVGKKPKRKEVRAAWLKLEYGEAEEFGYSEDEFDLKDERNFIEDGVRYRSAIGDWCLSKVEVKNSPE